MSWHGWLWQFDHWERVCDGRDMGECSRRLGAEADRRGVLDRFTAMTSGGVPQFKPREDGKRI